MESRKQAVPGLLLIALLLAASITPLAAPAVAEEQEGLQLDVYMNRDSFKLEVHKQGYNESLENIYLDSYLKATGDMVTGYLKAWGITENMTEFTAYSRGYLKAEVTNTTATMDIGTKAGASFTINSTSIDPTSPPKMLPTTIDAMFSLSSVVLMDTNETMTSFMLKMKPNISDGLPFVLNSMGLPMPMPVPGDFALWLNVSIDIYTNVPENKTSGTILVYLDFETGNLAIDAQLASIVQTGISFYLNEQMVRDIISGFVANPTVALDSGLQPGDSSIFYIKITYQGQILPPSSVTMPSIPVQAPVTTANVSSIIVTPTFTPIDVNASVALEWSLEAESIYMGSEQYNVSVKASIDGNYTGPQISPTGGELEAWAKVDNGSYECYVRIESSYENPVTGLMAVKQAADILFFVLPEDTLVTVNFITEDGIKVVDTSTKPPSVVSTVSFRAGELGKPFPLDSLGVIYDDIIIDTSGGIISIVSDNIVSIDYGAAALADAIEVQAPGVEILLGATSTTLQTFLVNLDPNRDMDPEATIEIMTGSIVGDQLSFQVIDRDEASQLIDTDRYSIVGVPFKGKGLIGGEAIIELTVDPGASGVKVVKVSGDGQVQVIEDVVKIGDKVRFTTTSFSTFIPVVEKEAQEETTTATETMTTEPTTTTTTQEQETTTQNTTTQTETTETTTQETTTTTPETTQEEATTTTTEAATLPQETTTQTQTEETTPQQTTTRTLPMPTGTTETTTQTGQEEQPAQATEQQPAEQVGEEQTPADQEEGGGISPAMIGVAALIVIVIAAVVLLRR